MKTHGQDLIGITSSDNGYIGQSHGLTKREYFAAMAMQGLMASDTRDIPENLAIGSVAVADALIAELNRSTTSE